MIITRNLKNIRASTLDLHIHSNASVDGQFSPRELVKQVAKYGVHTVAVSDHDTVRNVLEMMKYANQSSIEVIPAGEFSCDWKKYDIHVLGYGIQIQDKRFEQLKQELEERMCESSKKMVEAVKAMGIVLQEEKIWKQAVHGVIAPERIGESALELQQNRNHPVLQPFFPGGERSDNPVLNFAWDICERGGPAYIPVQHNTPDKVVDLIHDTGGVAILAHPGCCFGKDISVAVEFLEEFQVDGIEVYSSYHEEETMAVYRKLAEERNMLVTSGSDFHGKTKPNLTPGCVSCENRENEILERLKMAIKKRK